MHKTYIGTLAAFAALLPFVANAQVTLGHTIGTISNIINALIPIVLAIAVLVFFWGLAQYLLSAGDSEKRGQGINIMFMGIIVIFVMVSVWGIIAILQNTFRVQQVQPIIPPVIQRGS